MIAGLISVRRINNSLENLNQLFQAMFDVKVYYPDGIEAVHEIDYTALWNKLQHNISPLDGPRILALTTSRATSIPISSISWASMI
jgi:hypothetical protein